MKRNGNKEHERLVAIIKLPLWVSIYHSAKQRKLKKANRIFGVIQKGLTIIVPHMTAKAANRRIKGDNEFHTI